MGGMRRYRRQTRAAVNVERRRRIRRRRPVRIDGGPVEWPGLTGTSFTFEGQMGARQALVDNLAKARGPKATFEKVLLLAPWSLLPLALVGAGVIAVIRYLF